MKKQISIFLCLILISAVFSACAPEESTVLDLKEPAKEAGETETQLDGLPDAAGQGPEEPQTVIPVVGKEEDAPSGDTDQTNEEGSGGKAQEHTPQQDENIGNNLPSDEGNEPQSSDQGDEISAGVDSRVGVSVNYIYELYQNDAGADMLNLRMSTPQVYYSDGIPLQNVNAYYTQYLDAYRTEVETQTLKLVTEYSKNHQNSDLSTVEMAFSVTYNENWLLSVTAKENLYILGTRTERSGGQTFDTKRDTRLSVWDLLSQADAQECVVLPAVWQVLDSMQISYDPALLVSQLDFYSFTIDSTGLTLYIDCQNLDASAQQTAQVFLAFSTVSSCLQPEYSALFQSDTVDMPDEAA